jgi:hypothetical protein
VCPVITNCLLGYFFNLLAIEYKFFCVLVVIFVELNKNSTAGSLLAAVFFACCLITAVLTFFWLEVLEEADPPRLEPALISSFLIFLIDFFCLVEIFLASVAAFFCPEELE